MNRLRAIVRRLLGRDHHAVISVQLHPDPDQEAYTEICHGCLDHLAHDHPRYFEEMRELLNESLDSAWRKRNANL